MDSSNSLSKAFKELVTQRVLTLAYEHITKFARELEDDVVERIFKDVSAANVYKQGMFDAAEIVRVALIAQQQRLEKNSLNPPTKGDSNGENTDPQENRE